MAWDHVLHKKPMSEIVEIVCSRFESGDTDEGKEFSIGGAAIHEVLPFVSNAAYEKIRSLETPRRCRIGDSGCAYRTDEYGGEYGLTFEHVIPNRVVRELLDAHWSSQKAAGRKMDRAYVSKVIEKLQVALISEDEGKMLNSSYKDTMPNQNWAEGDDIFGRYRAVFGNAFKNMWHTFWPVGELAHGQVVLVPFGGEAPCEVLRGVQSRLGGQNNEPVIFIMTDISASALALQGLKGSVVDEKVFAIGMIDGGGYDHKMEVVKIDGAFGNPEDATTFACVDADSMTVVEKLLLPNKIRPKAVFIYNDGQTLGEYSFSAANACVPDLIVGKEDAMREFANYKNWRPDLWPSVRKHLGAEFRPEDPKANDLCGWQCYRVVYK